MTNKFPVGKAQQQVLDALGLKADSFQDACTIFDEIGITVASKREGRHSIPVVFVHGKITGGFNECEGYSDNMVSKKIDLTPIRQWIEK